MEEMQDPYKDIARALRTPAESKESIIKNLRFLMAKSVESKKYDVEIPPGLSVDPAEFQTSYQIMMTQTIIALAQCEIAMMEGNYEVAIEKYTEVKDLRKKGHNKFQPE